MNVIGKTCGFFYFGMFHQIIEDIGQIRYVFFRCGIFPGSHGNGLFIRGKVQNIGFNAGQFFAFCGIAVHGDKQVGPLGIGNGGSFLQGQFSVCGPGKQHLTVQAFTQFYCKGRCQFEYNILFPYPFDISRRTGILAAVAGVNDDFSDT